MLKREEEKHTLKKRAYPGNRPELENCVHRLFMPDLFICIWCCDDQV